MKNSVLTTLVSIGLLAASSAVFAAGDASRGEALSGACAVCHGDDGNSLSPAFPKIAGLGEKYLLKQLQDIKSGDRNVMEMAGQLDASSDQDLADIAAFYASQTTQLSGSTEFKVKLNSGVEVSSLELGAKLYRAGKLDVNTPSCSGCHSPTGMGNAPAGYPRISGQHADYLEKQLLAFRESERSNDGEARTMRSVTQYLSNAEIKALANYIAGLH